METALAAQIAEDLRSATRVTAAKSVVSLTVVPMYERDIPHGYVECDMSQNRYHSGTCFTAYHTQNGLSRCDMSWGT